jgi:glycosyltransferase involved in cell wall biosynthesis
MKVLFIARSTFYSAPGGDTMQAEATAKYLRRAGVHVSIRLCNEKINYADFDLLHFFNIIRPADHLKHIKASGKPFVISPVFVDYSEYERFHRRGWAGKISRLLPPSTLEYLKVIARRIFNGEKIISPSYLFMGHKKAVRYLLENAKMLLPNSESEYSRLRKAFGKEAPYSVIPNGVDPELFHSDSAEESTRTDVLCAARIEGVKNQLNLVRALNNAPYRLTIAGKASPNAAAYEKGCREAAGSNIIFTGQLSKEELIQQYKKAKVHVLPSWFETTGLSSLEAAVMGCNLVVSDRGDTREYFGDSAFCCEPGDPASIREKVEQAMNAPFNEAFRQHILQHYTWEIAAAKTLQAYKLVLDNINKT